MRSINPALLCLGALTVLAVQPALAHGHGHRHGHVGFGVYFNPWFPGYYVPPTYFNPQTILIPSAPQVYVQQEPVQIAPPAPQAAYWYYCAPVQKYYPYVKDCPGGWQTVPAQPPAQ